MLTEVKLMRDDTLLGNLRVVDMDQPWFLCDFAATSAFDALKPLFAQELALIESTADLDVDAWEEVYAKIDALHLRLVPSDGQPPITEFLLHIEGSEAKFRY